jgi:perosamine synthetase
MVAAGTMRDQITAPRQVPLTRPSLGEEEVEAVARVIRSGWVTQGPEVAAFERDFARFVDAPYACAVSNCTVALHLALRAVGVSAGDEVVTVSHSFIATANAVRYCGAIPVFVDIDPQTFNIDPARVERAIGPRTRALLVVHQLGMPADLTALVEIASRHGIRLVEDAACAIGSEILWKGRWERIGGPHGDIACFSFHPRKLLTTGDGGMITTADPAFDAQMRRWRQHCMSVPDTVRHGSSQVVFEEYSALGYNFRMTDVQAAMGRIQLQRMPELLAERRALAARYERLLAAVPHVRVVSDPRWARSNWQSYAVVLPEAFRQRRVMQHLLDAGIACRRGVMSAHLEPAYQREPWQCGPAPGVCDAAHGRCTHLAESERITNSAIILPLYPGFSESDQDFVVQELAAACAREAGERI